MHNLENQGNGRPAQTAATHRPTCLAQRGLQQPTHNQCLGLPAQTKQATPILTSSNVTLPRFCLHNLTNLTTSIKTPSFSNRTNFRRLDLPWCGAISEHERESAGGAKVSLESDVGSRSTFRGVAPSWESRERLVHACQHLQGVLALDLPHACQHLQGVQTPSIA